jgi:hypothetical protein
MVGMMTRYEAFLDNQVSIEFDMCKADYDTLVECIKMGKVIAINALDGLVFFSSHITFIETLT